MIHKDKKEARRYDTPYRCRSFTDKVYGGEVSDKTGLIRETFSEPKKFYPEKSKYNIYFGELHGHTNLSDGSPEIDEYFRHLRDTAELDFGALSDHDHGGVGNPELFGEKWELIKSKVKEYYEPGKFTTILAYERDSYPWYNNMVVYYGSHNGEMLRGVRDGEITKEELSKALSRDDILLIPHDTYHLESGTDFMAMPSDLFTPMIEIYSRGDCAEYFGNEYNSCDFQCEGGFWQDALRRGARMGCVAASDDHDLNNGITMSESECNHFSRFPGITAVLCEENTVESVFAVLKARRTYGFMGGKMYIDFRISGHYMGEEYEEKDGDERSIYFNISADTEVEKVTLVKNCRDYMIIRRPETLIVDYKAENDTDVYYLRVELSDGRWGWTSPIWVNRK